MDNKAQISVEMIIIMAALVAMALLLVTNLHTTADNANTRLGDRADALMKEIDRIK